MIARWLRTGLLAALVVGACWGGAVWYWRATNRMPSTDDLVLVLLVLPLALLLAFWGSRKLYAAFTAAAPVAPAAAPPVATRAPEPTAAPALALVAAAVRAPHGSSAGELLAAIAEHAARPDLDPELVDDSGFPVMSARSADASDTSLLEEIRDWLAANGMPDLRFSDEQWRALVLGSSATAELAGRAAHLALVPAPRSAPAILQLLPMLPAEWSAGQRSGAGMWLRHVATQEGWPADRVALAADLPGSGPADVLARLARHCAASGAKEVAIVVACGSHIGQASVDGWSASASLFTASRSQGLIPGEGAAGVLVADAHQAGTFDDAAHVLLHLADGRREHSADDARRADAALLQELTVQVLAHLAAATDVAMVVADTGHRSSRVLELMGLASAALPHLDAASDVVRVGAGHGHCGEVPFMAALALARHHALERGDTVLCIANEDPYRRCAALIRPAAALS